MTDPRSLRTDAGTCAACGAAWTLALGEIRPDHTFATVACCEVVEAAVQAMPEGDGAADLMRALGVEDAMRATLRRVVREAGAGPLLLDCLPQVGPIGQPEAFAFVAAHHQHCGILPGWRFGAGIWNGPTLLGVVVVGNVSGRGFNGRGWVEVRRVCVDLTLPAALRWRACSMLYRWAAERAEALGYGQIITYTLEDEAGMTLRYARWKPVAVRKARKGWSCAARPRENPTPTGMAKTLWAKALRPTPQAVEAREAVEAAKAAEKAKAEARRASRSCDLLFA